MIFESDLVRLRYAHSWIGRVLDFKQDEVLVLRLPQCVSGWMPLELLELAPGQEEEFAA